MCFSATASFAMAAATGTIGILTLSKLASPRELPLAAIPLVFGVQQGIEGALWLSFKGIVPGNIGFLLANAFVYIALVLWPILMPFAVGLMEQNRDRRLAILAIVPVGLILSSDLAALIAHHPFSALVSGHRICYISPYRFGDVTTIAYVICTCAPLLMTTEIALKAFGSVVILGGFVAIAVYFTSFVSVWCFFAAAASIVIYAFMRKRRAREEWLLSPNEKNIG